MQEKKNKRLLVLLVVLLLATMAAVWLTREEHSFEVDKNLFKAYDLKTVDQVVLESRRGTVTLHYNGSRWKVNEHFDADRNMVEVLLATLLQAEPKRPVAATLRDSVSRLLQERGVKVSLSAAGKPVETFYCGGLQEKSQTYFSKAGGEPYLVTIPGYRVYVAGIFELPESGWRDKFVFGFNWRNFMRLEAEFPARPADNFAVALQDRFFSIQGLSQADTTKLNDYLDDVSLLTADEFVATTPVLDSLSKTAPIMTVRVKDIGQREFVLQLFAPTAPRQPFRGLIGGQQWALLAEGKVVPILRPKNFFGK
ncbi:DUF4340 domain-containing protein [Chryseolinea lacunae]|uniref:DUF4340 domain-containing protein n=1 Tax=Chryseolinea lacunae TaxID=2801331 RepID=A0ABS1KP63_9BACT|nr:DUF4340 domain-containing protein [Chryseolinea lacunae]MBL0741240.1 DUF4340 domain-containing protein [Chryseolinea lacunae]